MKKITKINAKASKITLGFGSKASEGQYNLKYTY